MKRGIYWSSLAVLQPGATEEIDDFPGTPADMANERCGYSNQKNGGPEHLSVFFLGRLFAECNQDETKSCSHQCAPKDVKEDVNLQFRLT